MTVTRLLAHSWPGITVCFPTSGIQNQLYQYQQMNANSRVNDGTLLFARLGVHSRFDIRFGESQPTAGKATAIRIERATFVYV